MSRASLVLSPGRPGSAHDEARSAIAALGPAAGQKVQAGVTHYLSAWLGWPDWLRDNTSLTGTGPLPRSLTVADDLIVIANLLEMIGPRRLLERVLNDVRNPVGPLTALAVNNAPDLRQGLVALARLANPHRGYLGATIMEDANEIALTIEPTLPKGRLASAAALLIMILGYRLVSSFAANLDAARLQCSLDGADLAGLAAQFDCKVLPAAPGDRLSIPRSWGDLPNDLADATLWRLAMEQIDARERSLSRPDPVALIRDRVARTLNDEQRAPRLKEMACESMSARTIARVLATHGTSFHALVEEERRMRAALLVPDPKLSLADVAQQLGFTDMSSFGRSFRRWFGTTPARFRSVERH